MTDGALRKRLAAILAADAAGYSRLMATDEPGTVAALDDARAVFRAQIEANQGRVVDTAGDSVLAVFETASGAVGAALAVQKALAESSSTVPDDRRMCFRIGIHLGDVIEKADGTVYGDGVNIAARLEGLAEPSGITVSESVRTAVKGKVAASFDDLGAQQVKNVSEPVHAYRVNLGTIALSQRQPLMTELELSLPNKPSIAVLPFSNMSGDPEQEYFADGVTEDIITELSRFRSLFVIARNSTFTYKGRSVDVRVVAKDLAVRYVLEGSVRKASSRIRITAQLIDAMEGGHLWAERYDRVLEDIFAVQEDVTQSIVAAIAPEVEHAERTKVRKRRPTSISAYDLSLHASANAIAALLNSDPALQEEALKEARQALALDPDCSGAHHTIAMLHFMSLFLHRFGGAEPTADPRWQEGAASATRLLQLDPSGSAGYARMAALLSIAGRRAEALTHARRACELNPNDVDALGILGYAELMEGDAKAALEHAMAVTRLNPRDPLGFRSLSMCTAACFLLRDHKRGLDFGLRAVSAGPGAAVTHSNLLLVAVGAGDIDMARTSFAAVERIDPEFAKNRLSGDSPYHRPQDAHRVTLAWRIAAGLNDPAEANTLR